MKSNARIAILAYPEISESDRRWIESVRRDEDPECDAVRLHLTLAFPAPVEVMHVVSHASKVARYFPPIRFDVSRAQTVPGRTGCHTFLVPSLGGAEISVPHDRLYEGPFGPHLLPGLPFIPHMTVGAHATETESRSLVARLEAGGLAVRGRIREISVVEVRSQTTPLISTLELGGSD